MFLPCPTTSSDSDIGKDGFQVGGGMASDVAAAHTRKGVLHRTPKESGSLF